MAGAGTLAVSYLAGALTTLSPCVLPLLPVLLLSAVQQHVLGPLALAGGLTISFVATGILIASVGFAAGVDNAILRSAVSIALLAFGAVLVVPALQAGFARIAAPLAAKANGLLGSISPAGVWGQFLLGLLLGVVWSPCTGPTLGVAVGLATQSDTIMFAAVVMTLFSLGASTPVLALAYGSRSAIVGRRNSLAIVSRIAKPLMGIALITVGTLTLTGIDKVVETYLTDAMPTWLVELTTRY